ncbi:EAL domain-containing protein [Halomonas sp. CH40]
MAALAEADIPLLPRLMPPASSTLHGRVNTHDILGPALVGFSHTLDDTTYQSAMLLGVHEFLSAPFPTAEVQHRLTRVHEHAQYRQQRDQQIRSMEQLLAKRSRELKRNTELDPATELPNRRGLLTQLRRQVLAGHGAGVVFVALEGLEDIICLHGYRITKRLLRHLTQRLKRLLTSTQMLGLWGGNELVIVTHHGTTTELIGFAQQLLGCFEQEQQLEGMALTVKARLGLSLSRGYFEPERLVQQATQALPPPGAAPRWQLYSDIQEEDRRQQASLLKALRTAITRQGFTLAYQPKVVLATGHVEGAEVLLRWNDPVHGVVPPSEFIPLSERSGDILAIGHWVFEAAITQLADWESMAWLSKDFHLAVNVAALQLVQPDFASRVLSMLQSAGVATKRLTVEVTESGLMADLDQACQQLRLLQRAGVRVAIDDFGMGYSSLSYLKNLPVDTLKIDRSFVKDVINSSPDQRLARMVTALAHGFGCNVVAEGIETDAQHEWLHAIGCEQGQGYLFARPLDADAFQHWYRQQMQTRQERPALTGMNAVCKLTPERRQTSDHSVRMLMTLMAGMAHEFNNLLGTISGLSELNQHLLSVDNPIHANSLHMHKASQRLSALLDDMTQCVGRFAINPSIVDPMCLMQSALEHTRIKWPEGLTPQLEASHAPAQAYLDGDFVIRALMQMIYNALDAMANLPDPMLTLSVAEGFNDQGVPCLLLGVQDNGSGIDDEYIPYVFDAFFTTKPPGENRGLGMTTIDVCAFRHDGDVLLSSLPDQGTYIALRLPLQT